VGHLASGNPAGSDPPYPIPQTLDSSLQLGCYETNYEPIFAARLPGFGILTNVGRKSGRLYRTPVNVFRAPDGFLIALTYGRESEWVRNVDAAGGCQLETRGVRYLLSSPTIVHDPTRRRFPLFVRMMLGIIGANDFMQLRTSYAIRGVAS